MIFSLPKHPFFSITIFLLFLPLFIFAQTHKIDSLKILLTKATHDTVRLDLKNQVGEQFLDINQDSALSWWYAGYNLAKEKQSQYSGSALNRLLLLEGNALSNIAYVYTDKGMTKPALDYNFKSLELRESIKDTHGIAESLNNIAFIYGQQKDTVNAIKYYERSAAGYESIHDTGGVVYTQINRARIYAARHQDALAIDMYTKAKNTLSHMPENHRGYSTCLSSLGVIYLRDNDYAQAWKFLCMALAVREKNNDQPGIAGSWLGIGRFYQQKEMPDSALYFAAKGFALAQKTKNAQYIISGSQLLSDLYKARGDFEKALSYYNIFISTRDSVSSDETGKQMVRQQMGYEYAQRSAADSLGFVKEKEVGEVKLSRQRGYTIGGFSALAIVGMLLFFVYRQRNGIAREKKRSDELLLNILPADTAEELKATGAAKTKSYSSVTVMFTDFKNFTQTAELLSAEELVALINFCYGEFDKIVSKYNVEKIKTIGDSYMCAGGLPAANETNAADTVNAAIEMLAFTQQHNEERKKEGLPFFDIRIGIHSGPVVAGIVGTKKFAYDIWGDTVNIASRMESSGEPGRINVSESTYEQVKRLFKCEHRGKIKAKNKGEIDMYFVNGKIL
jgi:adenylate cyclase